MTPLLFLDSPVSFDDVNSLNSDTYDYLKNLSNTRISITGANGFLASNIVFYLFLQLFQTWAWHPFLTKTVSPEATLTESTVKNNQIFFFLGQG